MKVAGTAVILVGDGQFPETVTITAKGTAAALIRFVGQQTFADVAPIVGVTMGAKSPDHAFVLSGAQYVTITGVAPTAMGAPRQTIRTRS